MKAIARILALSLVAGCDAILGIEPTEEVVVWEDGSFDDMEDGPLAGNNGWTTDRCSPAVQSGALRLTPTADDLCDATKSVPTRSDGRHRLIARVRIARFPNAHDDFSLARLRIRTKPSVEDNKALQVYVGRNVRATYPEGDGGIGETVLVGATRLGVVYEVRIDIDLPEGAITIAVDDVEAPKFHYDADTIVGLNLTGWNVGGEAYLEELRGITGY